MERTVLTYAVPQPMESSVVEYVIVKFHYAIMSMDAVPYRVHVGPPVWCIIARINFSFSCIKFFHILIKHKKHLVVLFICTVSAHFVGIC